MNKFEKKQLEKKVSEIMGCEVEIVTGRTVLPMHKDKQSIDMRLLELENKHRLSIEKSLEMKERRRQNKPLNRLMRKLDSVAKSSVEKVSNLREELPTIVEEISAKVADIDVADMIHGYFFGDDEEVIFNGHYNHTKHDVVDEGNITYLSRDFVDFE